MATVYHLAERGTFEALPVGAEARYAPPSLATEGFVHLSERADVLRSCTLYFQGKDVEVWRIEPSLLDVPLKYDATPRGPMPHVYGSIPAAAIVEILTLGAFAEESEV